MKLIITGARGFVGGEVLRQSLQNEKITSIVALLRKRLPQDDPKVKQMLMKDEDWLSYPETVTKELRGAEGCVWCIGVKPNDNAPSELLHRVSIDYQQAAADAFASAAAASGVKMRFVYVSGGLVERDQSKSLWFTEELRKVRGRSETILVEAAEKHPDQLQVAFARIGAVYKRENSLASLLAYSKLHIGVDELAASLIELALHGSEKQIWWNGELARKGQALLKAR
ncbi:hypothetical protein P7C71_g1036, partial [Lecanoromycetidae sp. Uapishka_2]